MIGYLTRENQFLFLNKKINPKKAIIQRDKSGKKGPVIKNNGIK